jgi:hypothetical protein
MESRLMTGPLVLLLTHSADVFTIDRVIRALEERGAHPLRLDTDRSPTEVGLAAGFSPRGEHHSLRIDSREIDLEAVTAVWNRRFSIGRRLPQDLDPRLRGPAVEESRHSLRGLLGSLLVFQLDPLARVERARNKLLQLRLAREAGLTVPATLVSNDPHAVRAFAARQPAGVVCKMLTSFAVYDEQGAEQVVFTNILTTDDLADLGGLELSPMTFQERVPKALELRATVVGRRVWTAAIDSQSSERARDDWRRDGAAMVHRWVPHELAEPACRGLLALVDRLGLNYGAADFILTPGGETVFLEVNPAGEWFWLERHAGLPLAREIAALLTDPSTQRVP